MQPEPTQPKSPSREHRGLLHGNRRSRTSGRPIKATREQAESSNAPTTGRRAVKRSSPGPQQASSREMTPAEDVVTIKYTRTGRVSRANKGKRVHQCEECGKIYTRAEHLRRHQQNHKPGTFPCDIKGCDKAFYREDLLGRHKAKQHNVGVDPDTAISPTRSRSSERPSDLCTPLPPPINLGQVRFGDEVDIVQTSSTPVIDRERRQHLVGTSTQKHGGQSNFPHSRPHRIPVITQGYSGYESGGYTSDSSVSYSLSDYASPSINNYTAQPYPSHPGRTRHSSTASFLDPVLPFHSSPSPVSAGSSTILPHWANNNQNTPFQYYPSFLDSNIGYTNGAGVKAIADVTGIGSLPDPRDLAEKAELSLNMDSPQSSTWSFEMDDDSTTQDDTYLSAYWCWIHPLFSVVHKQTFNPHQASPLLKAAMIALGASSCDGTSDKNYARIIHERCTKVLKQRALNPLDSLRICDMQAIVLIEVYSIFKSRRPPLQFSRHFEDVYQLLANDPEAFDASTIKSHLPPSSLATSHFNDGSHERLLRSYYVECKQRLLLGCYMLDQQHAILFGRPRSESFSGSGTDLPLPRPQALWDGTVEQDFFDWPALTIGDQYQVTKPVHDVFQSILTIGSFFDTKTDSAMNYNLHPKEDTNLRTIVSQSPRTELAYHTFGLCANTPIRNLLAVVGESWIMAEKLGHEEEYTKAQLAAWNWAMGHTMPKSEIEPSTHQSEIQLALTHALQILELQQNNEKTGLPFQEWSVYLASVVVWASAYVLSDDRQPKSTTNPAEQQRSLPDLDRIVSSLVGSGTPSSISLEDALNILLWTQKKIASVDIPHNCGLTNSVLDVLGRLVTKGTESGWFGQ